MDIVNHIQRLQEKTGNRVPKVVFFGQFAHNFRRINVRALINEAVMQNKLMWGKTPHTEWYATELGQEDRKRIAEMPGWSIEAEIE